MVLLLWAVKSFCNICNLMWWAKIASHFSMFITAIICNHYKIYECLIQGIVFYSPCVHLWGWSARCWIFATASTVLSEALIENTGGAMVYGDFSSGFTDHEWLFRSCCTWRDNVPDLDMGGWTTPRSATVFANGDQKQDEKLPKSCKSCNGHSHSEQRKAKHRSNSSLLQQ